MIMERMTELYNGKVNEYYKKCSLKCYPNGFSCSDCEKLDNLVNRLGAYEDTGLTPEEVVDLKARMDGLCK